MKIIIPILVGASIGYLTNWLAIKMLFRPLKEKKILGFKVPFTPGLIPKEKERMAKSVGEAVGMHLLTPEKIAEVVSSEETKERLENFITIKIDNMKSSDMSLKDFLLSINYDLPIEEIDEKLFRVFSNKLKDEDFKLSLVGFLKEDIYPKYSKKLISKINKEGKELIEEIKNSKALKDIFIEGLYNKSKELKDKDVILSDIVDNDLVFKIEKAIDTNRESIVGSLRRLFYKDDIQSAIISSIENLVEANVSKMITMFVDSQTITEKIFMIIKKYIDSEQAEEAASLILKDSVKNLLNTEVYTIIEKAARVVDGRDISKGYDVVLGSILDDINKEKLLNLIQENIENNEVFIKNKLEDIFNRAISDILESEKFKTIFKDFININIDKLLNRPFKSLLKDLDEKSLEKIFKFTNNLINTRFKDELFNIISLFDISKVVEDEINSFEVEYTEKLILEIADRELKAITRLGALLGAIMGLLTPILQMI